MENALFTPEMASRSAWLIAVGIIEYLPVLDIEGFSSVISGSSFGNALQRCPVFT